MSYPTNRKVSEKSWRRIVYVTALVVMGALIYRLARTPPRPGGPREGSAAPRLRLVDLSGQTATLEQYRGRVVLLDFWATWCDACNEELPSLKTLYADFHGRGLEFLAVSVDEAGRKALLPFVAQNAIPWRVLLADSDVVESYRVFGLPTKFLIDPQGIVARKYVGSVDPKMLEQDIRELLRRKNT